MGSDEQRGVEVRRFQRIDAAFRAGHLAALPAAVDDPAATPNGRMALATDDTPLADLATGLAAGAPRTGHLDQPS